MSWVLLSWCYSGRWSGENHFGTQGNGNFLFPFFTLCKVSSKSELSTCFEDKILQSTNPNEVGKASGVTVTNDGATILKSIPVENPSAKILVNISRTQDDEVGDGTTTVVVLAGELLREAERLVSQKIHPQTIIAGKKNNASNFRCKKEVGHLNFFFFYFSRLEKSNRGCS